MSIKLSERQTMDSNVRGILERHFAVKTDENTLAARHERLRLHDIAQLVTDEVLRVQKDAAIERDKAPQEMAAGQPMAGPDSSTIRPMTAREALAETHVIGTVPTIGKAADRDKVMNYVVMWCRSAPFPFIKDIPFRIHTLAGTIEVKRNSTGNLRGEFI